MKIIQMALAGGAIVFMTATANAGNHRHRDIFGEPCPKGQTQDVGTLECVPIYNSHRALPVRYHHQHLRHHMHHHIRHKR